MSEEQKLYFALGALYMQSKLLSQETKWTVKECIEILLEELEKPQTNSN